MVSDILRPGNKVEIKAVQKIERQGSTGEVAHVYTSRIQEIHENGDIDISMPIEEGKYVLLHLGVRFEFVFYAEKNLYRAIGQVKERFKSNNIYMLKVELKTQLAKFQRREYYRFQCEILPDRRKRIQGKRHRKTARTHTGGTGRRREAGNHLRYQRRRSKICFRRKI